MDTSKGVRSKVMAKVTVGVKVKGHFHWCEGSRNKTIPLAPGRSKIRRPYLFGMPQYNDNDCNKKENASYPITDVDLL